MLEGAPREVSEYTWVDLLPMSQVQTTAMLSESERRQRAALSKLDLEDALVQFATQIELGAGFNQQWPMLRDYFEARPDQIPLVAEALENGDFPNDVQPAVYLAIGKARVPEARDALLGINRNVKALPLHRVQTALLLADRSDTPPGYAKELRVASQALSSSGASENDQRYGRNAVLALGMFAARQGDRDATIASEARASVAELLRRGQTMAELSPVFGAIGNLGDPAMLPEIESWSRHQNIDIRASVPMALRRISVERETPLFTEWLARETDPTVRRELWSVLYRQLADEQRDLPEVFVEAAVKNLRAQPDLLTRQPLVRLLSKLAKRDDRAKQALLEQCVVELNSDSGLLDVLQAALPGDEVSAALKGHVQ